jgi:hypothetical protein
LKRHRFDPFSFLFGAIFLSVTISLLLNGDGATAFRPARLWSASLAIIGVGLAGWAIARAIAQIRSRDRVGDDPRGGDLDGAEPLGP